MKPIRRLKILDAYVGEWVAVRDGAVVAHAASSVALAAEMERAGDCDDAVVQFVPPPSDSWRVGVG